MGSGINLKISHVHSMDLDILLISQEILDTIGFFKIGKSPKARSVSEVL